MLIVLCIQFIGDGLRDAFDPRQKRVPKQKDLKQAEAAALAGGEAGVIALPRIRCAG